MGFCSPRGPRSNRCSDWSTRCRSNSLHPQRRLPAGVRMADCAGSAVTDRARHQPVQISQSQVDGGAGAFWPGAKVATQGFLALPRRDGANGHRLRRLQPHLLSPPAFGRANRGDPAPLRACDGRGGDFGAHLRPVVRPVGDALFYARCDSLSRIRTLRLSRQSRRSRDRCRAVGRRHGDTGFDHERADLGHGAFGPAGVCIRDLQRTLRSGLVCRQRSHGDHL